MNIETGRREFARLDGKSSFPRSIVDGQSTFWRSIKHNSQSIKKTYGKMTLGKWMKIVLFACVVALAIDPLFLLVPVIDSLNFRITYDETLGKVFSVLRSVCDAFYLIHIIVLIIIKFRALSISKEKFKALLRQGSWICPFIQKTFWLLLCLIVIILSVIPLPQMLVLLVIKEDALGSMNLFKWIILVQYVPRFLRTYPIFMKVTKNTGNVTESKWIGATINFFLYMLFSYGFGAFWYISAIEKQFKCFEDVCYDDVECDRTTCSLENPTEIPKNSPVFNFGMYIDALRSKILQKKNEKDFPRKFIYCFRWGLRHLSALGQNLDTSSDAGENIFAIIITISGLLLFAILIGNVQKYLQSSTTRVDEKEENQRDTEKWMSKRKLPKHLKRGIRKHRDYKWRETRGMEEETLLQSLPKHLTKGIKRHLYGDLIKNLKHVRQFQNMDYRSQEDLCSRLKAAYYTANSCIVEEGEPVEDMLYIVSGELESTTTGGAILGAGYLYGEELFDWAFDPQSSDYPISKRKVTAKTEVEGFILSADDLKFVATRSRPAK